MKQKNLCTAMGHVEKRGGGAHALATGGGPGFESGIFHNDPDALQDHCVIM